VKFSPVNGSVRVVVGNSGKAAMIEVHDSGPGISEEHRAHIFERFYRVDKARARSAGGAGLGLSIAQWAVNIHGGTIEVESAQGNGAILGSIFRIRLPKSV
jgi:signal transduction histidine kinase